MKAGIDCCVRPIDRRAVTFGIASLVASNGGSIAQGASQAAGCAYLQADCSFAEKGFGAYPSINRMTDNAVMALGVIGVELNMLLGVSASPAFYDDVDSGPQGNAGALFTPFFPNVPVDGTVVFGTKCYTGLGSQSAAIAAVYAHEMGHLLQKKFVATQLYNLRNQDRSVVRAELHADFICGYYAAFRKQKQADWAAAIQAITQFKFGDDEYANPQHHGTRAERKAAVEAGLQFGSSGMKAPAEVANSGLEYVRSLVLDKTSKPQSC
jgi:hypothetical protein